MTTMEDTQTRFTYINSRIPGWSGPAHYTFFEAVLSQPWVRDLLIVGVYQGRDIAYLLDVAARHHPGRKLRIVGVDKFSDTPCDDWPDDRRGMDWRAAGFGEAPSVSRAWVNLHEFINPVRDNVSITLIPGDDAEYLATTVHEFDFAYLDTAHDEQTVARQLGQVGRVTRQNAIIAGDDYSDAGTWGVKRAVSAGTVKHGVFANWIWHCNRSDLK